MKKKANDKKVQRTRISDIRRQELTSAALRCIAARGYDLVTLDDVAKEAGFSQGIALYYFKNREALLASAIESIWDNLMAITRRVWNIPEDVEDEEKITAYIRKYYSNPEIDFISILTNGIKLLLHWFKENPHIILVALEFWSQVPRNPKIMDLRDSFQPYIRNTTAVVIEEGIKRGVFKKREPDVAAHVLLSVVTGLAASHVVTLTEDFDILALEKDYTDLVFGYLCS